MKVIAPIAQDKLEWDVNTCILTNTYITYINNTVGTCLLYKRGKYITYLLTSKLLVNYLKIKISFTRFQIAKDSQKFEKRFPRSLIYY